jgi:hypothetical protein
MVEILDAPTAHARFKKQLGGSPALKSLHGEALKRGYKSTDTPDETFAIRLTSKASARIHAPLAIGGGAVQDVEFELVGQSMTKGNSQGAIATCTVRSGKNEVSYEMLLEAPDGHFDRAREWTLENGKVIDAHSWWGAWVGCLHGRCASECLGALWQCVGTWAAYFWCVVARCGGCVLKCAACATCDCSWWCRWGTGCCDR